MEITYPFAKVFTDTTNRLNVFFLHDAEHSTFQQLGDMGTGIVDFCELDFSELQKKIQALETVVVPNACMEDIRTGFYEAVDLLKDKHSYAHFFLNSEMVRTFWASDKSTEEQISYLLFLFQYYFYLQKIYSEVLEFCLNTQVLTEYTLSERYVMFCNLHSDFTQHMLRSMYGVVPIADGRFDTGKLIRFDNPGEVDTKKVLQDIHRDSDYSVSMWQYFAVQSLEEMLYLELMEMVKRGIRVKRCALCDRYFVLADKRRRNYCDRIYDGKRTCKQVGAKKTFEQALEDDTYLQEFQRIYNRMYSRYYRMDAWDSDRQTNKLTEEQFKAWIAEASKARQAYRQGKISGEEMISRITDSFGD
jgi:hypothetical protein